MWMIDDLKVMEDIIIMQYRRAIEVGVPNDFIK